MALHVYSILHFNSPFCSFIKDGIIISHRVYQNNKPFKFAPEIDILSVKFCNYKSLLCKIIAYNATVLIREMIEMGDDPELASSTVLQEESRYAT